MLDDLSKNPFISSLLKKQILLNIDYFFASTFYKKSDENILLALSYIFAVSRHGHLCVKILDSKIYPDPKFLFSESLENLSKFKEKLALGFSSIPKELVRSEEEAEGEVKPLFYFKSSFYLLRNYLVETSICNHLLKLSKASPTKQFSKELFEKELGLVQPLINEKQMEATIKAFDNSISFIFGGPGTGKSYTAGILINLFSKLVKGDFRVILSAPTGKAAQNLESKINVDNNRLSISSYTLHSLLKINSSKAGVIDGDLVIVDEASMIDARMFNLLLESTIPGSRLIFIGDPYQLPPIESGNLFSVVSRLKLENRSTFLQRAVRNDSEKMKNISEAIRNEDAHGTLSFLKEEDHDISYKEIDDNVFQATEEILKNADKYYLPLSFGKENAAALLKKFSEYKILTPLKIGPFGVDSINNLIHQHIESCNKSSDIFAYPIMITKNDYELNLYNGTLGVIIRSRENNEIKEQAYFLDHLGKNIIRSVPLIKISSYELAYALSVHKSQGSEFDDILLLLPKGSSVFGRELLYTAITRTRKKLKILSSDKVVKDLVKSSSEIQSNLFERLSLMS